MTKAQQSERDEVISRLRKTLKPGTIIYTCLKHLSRSGMQREISLYIVENGEIQYVTGKVAKAMGERIGHRDGLVVSGCGMDMGFELVYRLGYVLYPKGFHLPKGKRGRNGDTSNWDEDGGYALDQRWI